MSDTELLARLEGRWIAAGRNPQPGSGVRTYTPIDTRDVRATAAAIQQLQNATTRAVPPVSGSSPMPS